MRNQTKQNKDSSCLDFQGLWEFAIGAASHEKVYLSGVQIHWFLVILSRAIAVGVSRVMYRPAIPKHSTAIATEARTPLH